MNPKTTVGDYEIVDGGNMGESWVDVYAADRLWTPRRINGVPFNGTKDIVIPASDFGIGYLNTTLALQAIPEEYTTSDYSPFEEDSILASLAAYLPPPQVNDSGIESTRVVLENEYGIEEYQYTIRLTKPIPPVVFPEDYPGEPLYAMRAFTTLDNERINVGSADLTGDFVWTLNTGWPYVTFELKEWVSDTTLMVEPRILDLPYSFVHPEDMGDFSYLNNIAKPYDIAWLICGLTSAGKQELAEKYISNLLTTRDIGMNCFYGYFDMSTGLYKNEYLTTETSAMCVYALSFFALKYPNSSVTRTIKSTIRGLINFLLSTCNDHFYTSDGTYGPGLTNFSTNSNLEGRAKDNILGYLALKIGSTVEGENNLDGLIGHIEQVITVDLWNATDGCFYYSDIDHTTKDCLTQAWGAIFLKAIGDTDKLTKCLASLDQFYTICNDGQLYVEPAAGYRLTPDDDGISFEATFITAMARMGNGQLNRGMSDIVSARNMFEELKGSLLINKDNPARELPAWPTLLSVGIPLVLRKPNGLFGLDYDIHDAGNEDAVHIHDASEVLGLGSVLGANSITELEGINILEPSDGDILSYSMQSNEWVNKPDPTIFTVELAPGTSCTSGQLLANTANGFVLADCKSVSTMQNVVYALESSSEIAKVKAQGIMCITLTQEDIGKTVYLGYNGNITLTTTKIGNEYIKAVGTVISTDSILFNSDTVAVRVYLG